MKQATEPSAPKRKKVLFVITKATWGGAQKYVFDLSTHLPEEFEPIVAFGLAGKLSADLAAAKIRTYPLPALQRDVAIWSDIQSFFQILECIRNEKPDVVHLNSSKAAAIGALAARLAGVRNIVFTVHGWPFKESRNFLVRGLIYFISWFTAVFSHAAIVVSKSDERIGKRMPFVGKKVRYVPLGIEMLNFLPREEAAAALSILTNVPRIVTVGELTHNKGHRYAIDAIARLKDRNIRCQYFIIGDGELREDLEKYAKQKKVETQIVFCGFVGNVSRFLKAFDVFLLPSLKEGTPYVLVEAEIAGLQIVATNAVDTFWKESGIVTLVPPASASLLAEAIEHAITQPTDATVQLTSTLDKMLKQTVALY